MAGSAEPPREGWAEAAGLNVLQRVYVYVCPSGCVAEVSARRLSTEAPDSLPHHTVPAPFGPPTVVPRMLSSLGCVLFTGKLTLLAFCPFPAPR